AAAPMPSTGTPVGPQVMTSLLSMGKGILSSSKIVESFAIPKPSQQNRINASSANAHVVPRTLLLLRLFIQPIEQHQERGVVSPDLRPWAFNAKTRSRKSAVALHHRAGSNNSIGFKKMRV